MQWGLWVGHGEGDQLVADRGAGVVHGGADHHRAVGADGRPGARQAGVAELDPDVAQLDAKRVGGDLGQHGGCAGAEFLGGGLHDGGAVGVQVGAGALGAHEERDRVGGGGHAGADEPVPVPLGPRHRVPAGPADPLRAALQALGQPVAGPRVAAAGLGPGQVAQPQLDRVDADFGGELVHRAFEGEHAERLARPAGERRGHRVAPHQPVHPLVGGAGIQLGRDAEGRLGPVVERRGDRDLAVPDSGQLPVPGRPELDVLFLFLAVPAGGEHLPAGDREPDRPPHMLGGHRGQGHVRPHHRLAAERAADEPGQDPDLGRGDPEQRGHGQLDRLDALARVIQRQLVAVPHRGGGQHLQRVVVVGGEPEPGTHADLGSREPGVDVAARGPPWHQAAEDPFRVVRIGAALVDRGDRRRLGVADLDQAGSVLRLLPGGGHDDRDRLPGVANRIVLHREECLARCRAAQQRGDQRHLVHLRGVVVGEDPGHPVGVLGFGGFDRGDPAVGYLGADNRSVGQVRQRYLTGVPR